jgi:hypothetical protein
MTRIEAHKPQDSPDTVFVVGKAARFATSPEASWHALEAAIGPITRWGQYGRVFVIPVRLGELADLEAGIAAVRDRLDDPLIFTRYGYAKGAALDLDVYGSWRDDAKQYALSLSALHDIEREARTSTTRR